MVSKTIKIQPTFCIIVYTYLLLHTVLVHPQFRGKLKSTMLADEADSAGKKKI